MTSASLQVTLVTGAASGIGKATSRFLTQRGKSVLILDRNGDALEAVRRELELPTEHAFACDVSEEAGVDRAIQVAARLGTLSAVVNAAGIGINRPAVETSLADFRRVLEVNLVGPFLVARAAARYWMARKLPGSIVNISSVSGGCGNGGRSAYGASKGGLDVLTYVLAGELGAHGIRVNGIAPGPVQTPLIDALHTKADRQRWQERIPLHRYAQPDEIAAAIAFLISEEASYVTGHILAVDGGFLRAGIPASAPE